MYLPHQPPLKYANHIISLSNEKAIVSVYFPTKPTLAMLCEAAAQSSAAFKQNSQDANYGFVVSYKNCEIISLLNTNSYEITVNITQDMGQLCEYYFEVNSQGTLFATGNFIITFK